VKFHNHIAWLAAALLTGCLAAVSCADEGETEPDKIDITLHSNSYVTATRTHSIVKGQFPAPEPSWKPHLEDYLFNDWYLDPECTQPFSFEKDSITGPMDLYAGYTKNITLTDKGKVARVTGNTWGESLLNPNQTAKNWNLGGTDLGIIWEMADGRYGVAFGDTFGSDFVPGSGGPNGTDWRSNVLGFSEETDFSKGLVFSDMFHYKDGEAAPMIIRENYYSFTYIPTAAISVNGADYVHYMYWEVGSRDRVKQNYSGFIRSTDNGASWDKCGQINFAWDSYFCMVGLAQREGDDYCYMIGAQSGSGYRTSAAKLARFKPEDILNKSKYEFWNGGKGLWIKGKESQATTILDGTVGELSFMYLEKYKLWITMYFDSDRYAICYRTAARLIGPWSDERVICAGSKYPQLYGSYMHPYCGKSDTDEIYWTMSQWQPYNVFLMKSIINQ